MHLVWKEVKLRLFANNSIVYIESLMELTKKATKINKFSKAAGCRINIQKCIALLYTRNEPSEIEI